MSRTALLRVQWGRQLLALERERGGGAGSWAEAAQRVHDRSVPHLAPLLGASGVQALLRRSASLARHAFPCLAEPGIIDSAAALRAGLESCDDDTALEAAAALFSTFFGLLDRFIGRRLTEQLVRGCWPELRVATVEENHE